MAWSIQHFDRTHDRSGFDCGQPSLNDFLSRLVTQYEKRGIGRTYVLVPEGENRVLGYYTLASGQLVLSDLPDGVAKKLPRHPIPVVLLARLAVDRTVQGQKLGELLLRNAFQRSLDVATQLGNFAVTVDAIDERAVQFYEKFGFVRLKNRSDRLFLMLETLRKA
jgi:GNAT superfamily N-acetyltransferase